MFSIIEAFSLLENCYFAIKHYVVKSDILLLLKFPRIIKTNILQLKLLLFLKMENNQCFLRYLDFRLRLNFSRVCGKNEIFRKFAGNANCTQKYPKP